MCWFSGFTLQADDGGMRKRYNKRFYTFLFGIFCEGQLVVHGDGVQCWVTGPTPQTNEGMRKVRAGLVVHGDGGAVPGHRPYSQMDDGGIREFEYFVRAGAVDLGDVAAVMILRPYSEADDGGMKEGSELLFFVLEVLCRFSGPTPQTDDGGMTEGPDLSFMVMEVQCWVTGPSHKWMMEESGRDGAVDLGDGGAVMNLRACATKGLWKTGGETRAFVYGKGDSCVGSAALRWKRMIGELGRVAVDLGDGGDVMILLPSPQTDDGGMRKGAGTVDLGDGCAVMILRTYSQTDDGGMREGRAGAVDLGDAGVVMILRPYSETDDGGMREAVDLGDGGDVMILLPSPQTDDGGMREGRAGAVDLGDAGVVMILRPYSETDDRGMREGDGAVDLGDGGAVMNLSGLRHKRIMEECPWGRFEYFVRAGAVDLGDVAAVMILRPYSEADDGGMKEGRREI
ncbi:hypothetical protein TNCV_2849241 [Trichonephila clavipes]|nr:hypothetical protein TNCV_2849241 [Trichonephila clavipes]